MTDRRKAMDDSAEKRSSPYQGLVPFDQKDASFFFGREKESRVIAANLSASPLTVVYGASGVGKSSILKAGVLPYIGVREDLLAIVHNTWQVSPLQNLKTAVINAMAVQATGNLSKPPKRQPLIDFLSEVAQVTKRRLMIILDQFEEYFLYHLPNKDPFDVQFSQAVVSESAGYSFLLSVREDSLSKLDRFQGTIPSLFDNYLRIDYLDRKAARDAIEQPIRKYNELFRETDQPMDIEESLIEEVLNQVQTGRVFLGDAVGGLENNRLQREQIEAPFLQLVMTRLWDETVKSQSKILRRRTLKRLGGAKRIVRTHLDVILSALSRDEQDAASEIFNMLVTPSGSKIAHSAGDLSRYTKIPVHRLRELLERLCSGDVRILKRVQVGSDRSEKIQYEIYHDVLAQPVLAWRRRYLASAEKAEAYQIIEELTSVIPEESEILQAPNTQAQSINLPLYRLIPYLEVEAVSRYLDSHLRTRPGQLEQPLEEVRFQYKFSDPDPLMERTLIFDAYLGKGSSELYFEVINVSSFASVHVFDRLYVKLSKLLRRRQAFDIQLELIVLLLSLPEEVRKLTRPSTESNERHLRNMFRPAIDLELLRFETIDFTLQALLEFEGRYLDDKASGSQPPWSQQR